MSDYHRCPTTGKVLINGIKQSSILGVEKLYIWNHSTYSNGGIISVDKGSYRMDILFNPKQLWSWNFIDEVRSIIHGNNRESGLAKMINIRKI